MKRSGLNVLGIIFGILSIVIVFTVAGLLIGQQSFRSPFVFNMGFKFDELENIFKSNQVQESDEEIFEGPFSEISIEAISGDIEITGWSEDYIKLEYTKSAPSREYLDYLTVEIDKRDDELVLKREFTGSGVTPRGEIDFILSIPNDKMREIEAKSISGKVICSNMTKDIDMDLQTTSGRIVTDAARNFSAKTISGEISFTVFGEDVNVRTTSGRIHGEFRLESNRGSIDIHSVSGSVKLIVPDNFEADVDLRSVTGSVDTDLPIKVTSSKRNSLEGTIGDGGVSVEIDTTSGSIRIQKISGDE